MNPHKATHYTETARRLVFDAVPLYSKTKIMHTGALDHS
jgi:hypothetical protein